VRLKIAALLLACACAADAADEEVRDTAMFHHWVDSHAAQVQAFENFLRQEQLQDVVPIHQLLRSASMWSECKAQPFQVPPPLQWDEVRGVLQLLRELRRAQVLGPFSVVSAYRDESLNRCAGGSRRSSHMRFAVDLLPLAPGDDQKLCAFWRREGQRWNMGLSRYPSGRIHVDRTGWRTWGSDYSFRTSFCNQFAEKRP
jgi:hypothetical protein